MSLQQYLSYSFGFQPASCYQNSPATPGYQCQWAGKNCVGGSASLAESGNFFSPKLTFNYRDCVYGTTGGRISPDLVLSDSLSQGRDCPGEWNIPTHAEKSWQSGYTQAAGMVTNSLNSGVPLMWLVCGWKRAQKLGTLAAYWKQLRHRPRLLRTQLYEGLETGIRAT